MYASRSFTSMSIGIFGSCQSCNSISGRSANQSARSRPPTTRREPCQVPVPRSSHVFKRFDVATLFRTASRDSKDNVRDRSTVIPMRDATAKRDTKLHRSADLQNSVLPSPSSLSSSRTSVFHVQKRTIRYNTFAVVLFRVLNVFREF